MPDDAAQRPRPFWSGTMTFGLVTIPVNLFPANRGGGAHWRMLSKDGKPLRRRFYCPEENRELEPDDLVRGYEIEEGEYVIVTDQELEALEPKKSRDIDIREFVDEEQIEPLFFVRSYFLTPGGESNKAYRLLAAAMEQKHQAGIATFVMRDKEYLVAIFSENGILRAETLRFADEIRKPNEVGLDDGKPASAKDVAAVFRQIEKAKQAKFQPAIIKDVFAERVEKLLEQKRKHHEDTIEVDETEPEDDDDTEDDILSILKQSLAPKERGRTARQLKRKAPKSSGIKTNPNGKSSRKRRAKNSSELHGKNGRSYSRKGKPTRN